MRIRLFGREASVGGAAKSEAVSQGESVIAVIRKGRPDGGSSIVRVLRRFIRRRRQV